MRSINVTDQVGMRPRTRLVSMVASTTMTVASVAAAELGAWLLAFALATGVLGIQVGAATQVWRARTSRRRLEDEARHLRAAVRTGAALLALTAVREGHDTTATVADNLGGLPDAGSLLDELVAAGLLTAAWTETTGQPYRRFALTPAGYALLSRTIHP